MFGDVAVRGVNLVGDDQADRQVHGGPDKAVYAYAAEDIAWWATLLGTDLGPGAFGENLTTRGVDLWGAVIGERWRDLDARTGQHPLRHPMMPLPRASRSDAFDPWVDIAGL